MFKIPRSITMIQATLIFVCAAFSFWLGSFIWMAQKNKTKISIQLFINAIFFCESQPIILHRLDEHKFFRNQTFDTSPVASWIKSIGNRILHARDCRMFLLLTNPVSRSDNDRNLILIQNHCHMRSNSLVRLRHEALNLRRNVCRFEVYLLFSQELKNLAKIHLLLTEHVSTPNIIKDFIFSAHFYSSGFTILSRIKALCFFCFYCLNRRQVQGYQKKILKYYKLKYREERGPQAVNPQTNYVDDNE